MYVLLQWQRTAGVSVYYVVYRCVFACIFLSIMIASIVDPASEESGIVGSALSFYAKWPIYLTHWGITMCTVQAVVGAILTIRERCLSPGLFYYIFLQTTWYLWLRQGLTTSVLCSLGKLLLRREKCPQSFSGNKAASPLSLLSDGF